MPSKIVNFALFQCVWFACILGAAKGHPWLGVVVGLVAIIVHLMMSSNAVFELLLCVSCGVLGYIFDSTLLAGDFIRFPTYTHLGPLSPLWMVMLWVCFATTMNVSMSWMKGRYVIACVMGVIAGPLSYLAGVRLGALELGANHNASIIAIAMAWGIAMPVLLLINLQISKWNRGKA